MILLGFSDGAPFSREAVVPVLLGLSGDANVLLAVTGSPGAARVSSVKPHLRAFRQPFADSLSPHGGQAAPQSAACDSEGINQRDLDRGMCVQQCRQTKPFSE